MKHEEKLDVLSRIDEEIVDRNTKRRGELWYKTERVRRGELRSRRAAIVLAAALTVLLVIGAAFAVAHLTQDPNAVRSIEKIAAAGNIDVYTITYGDGREATFTVTNLAPADSGATVTDLSVNGAGAFLLSQAAGNSLDIGTAVGSFKDAGTDSASVGLTDLLFLTVSADEPTDQSNYIGGATVAEDGTMTLNLVGGKDVSLGEVHKHHGGDGMALSAARINETGELVLGFASGETINLGRVVGKDGKDGVGIDGISLSDEGNLVVTLSNGTTVDLGNIKGQDGIGIAESKINDAGELVLTYTDGQSVNLGRIVGERGEDGVGIANIAITDAGELTITLTDNSFVNLGVIKGEDGKSAYELYKEKFGYEGTEEEWLFDLVNGRLATKVKYHVTFTDASGTNTVPAQEVMEGGKVTEPALSDRVGYTFLGWYLGEEKWNFAGDSVTENMTLEARWEALCIVTYDANGADGDYTHPPQMLDSGSKVTEPPVAPVRRGYTFLGWYYTAGNSIGGKEWDFAAYTVTESMTLKARWQIRTYTITYTTDGNQYYDLDMSEFQTDYTVEASAVTLPDPEQYGVTFLGWTFEGQDPPVRYATLPLDEWLGDKTVTAHWKRDRVLQPLTDTGFYASGTHPADHYIVAPEGTAFYAPADAIVAFVIDEVGRDGETAVGMLRLILPEYGMSLQLYGLSVDNDVYAGTYIGKTVKAGEVIGYSGIGYAHNHDEGAPDEPCTYVRLAVYRDAEEMQWHLDRIEWGIGGGEAGADAALFDHLPEDYVTMLLSGVTS